MHENLQTGPKELVLAALVTPWCESRGATVVNPGTSLTTVATEATDPPREYWSTPCTRISNRAQGTRFGRARDAVVRVTWRHGGQTLGPPSQPSPPRPLTHLVSTGVLHAREFQTGPKELVLAALVTPWCESRGATVVNPGTSLTTVATEATDPPREYWSTPCTRISNRAQGTRFGRARDAVVRVTWRHGGQPWDLPHNRRHRGH